MGNITQLSESGSRCVGMSDTLLPDDNTKNNEKCFENAEQEQSGQMVADSEKKSSECASKETDENENNSEENTSICEVVDSVDEFSNPSLEVVATNFKSNTSTASVEQDSGVKASECDKTEKESSEDCDMDTSSILIQSCPDDLALDFEEKYPVLLDSEDEKEAEVSHDSVDFLSTAAEQQLECCDQWSLGSCSLGGFESKTLERKTAYCGTSLSGSLSGSEATPTPSVTNVNECSHLFEQKKETTDNLQEQSTPVPLGDATETVLFAPEIQSSGPSKSADVVDDEQKNEQSAADGIISDLPTESEESVLDTEKNTLSSPEVVTPTRLLKNSPLEAFKKTISPCTVILPPSIDEEPSEGYGTVGRSS